MIGNYNGGGIKAGVVKVFISEVNRTLLKHEKLSEAVPLVKRGRNI